MKRKLVGKTESITYEEMLELKKKQIDDILTQFILLMELTDMDEDKKATVKVNMSGSVGNLANICELMGLLEDDETYFAQLPFTDGVAFEEDI